ncbi:MAG: transporter [Daejeonella sp.]
MGRKIWGSIILGLTCLITYAQKPGSDKELREMQTDRPDVTESAYTVDYGHFQYESDAIKLVRNKENDILSHEFFFNLANIKLGITKSTDLQVVVETYIINESKNTLTQVSNKTSGFGDLTLRIKQNIWGNTGGKSALAVMPYLTIPTSKFTLDKRVEGGIIFPFALELKNDWNFGAQVQLDFLKMDNGKAYQNQVLNSITFGKKLNDKFNAFAETFYTYTFKEEKFDAGFNGGLIYSVSDNFKLDAGFNYGLTKSSDKIYFVGFSFRY